LEKKLHHPKTGKPIDLAKSSLALFRRDFHKRLTRKRNVALRLDYLDEENGRWKIKDPKIERELISGNIRVDELEEADYVYHAVTVQYRI